MTTTPRPPSLWDQATSTGGGRWAVAVAIVAVCLLVATAAVALASSARQERAAFASTSTDAGARASGQDKDKGNANPGNPNNGKGMGDLSSIPGKLGGTLHGEVTRPSATGGTETLLVQTGSVTASSDTELTVKSSDGFTETYAVSATTTIRGPAKAAGLAVGTTVTVVAAKDGKRALLIASKGTPS
ncbi:MAG: hypothetical protein ABJA74_05260 [Lapillicoccus sp.]